MHHRNKSTQVLMFFVYHLVMMAGLVSMILFAKYLIDDPEINPVEFLIRMVLFAIIIGIPVPAYCLYKLTELFGED